MYKFLSLVILTAALILIPSDKSVTGIHPDISGFSGDHIIVKLKKTGFNTAASLSPSGSQTGFTGLNYENRLKEVFASNGITIIKNKPLFPAGRKNNLALYNKYELDTYYLVYFNQGEDIKKLCGKITESAFVDFSEPDYTGEAAGKRETAIKPNDEFFTRQWALYNDGLLKTTNGKPGKKGADMNVLNAWEVETGSQEIIVGILDSGVKTDHPGS